MPNHASYICECGPLICGPAGSSVSRSPARSNDVLGDALLRGGAGYVLQELAEEQVVGVGIHPRSATRRADGRRRDPHLDQLGRVKPREPVVVQALGRGVRQCRERLQGRVRIREVFRQAAGVVDQHPDGDRVAAFSRHQPRQVVADRRVEPDLTALDLLQDRGGGEGLGDAADAVPHVGSNGTAGADIGDAGGAAPHLVAVAHLGEHSRAFPRDGRSLGRSAAPRDRGYWSPHPSLQFPFQQPLGSNFGRYQPIRHQGSSPKS